MLHKIPNIASFYPKLGSTVSQINEAQLPYIVRVLFLWLNGVLSPLISRLPSPPPTEIEERDKASNFNGPPRPTAWRILSNFFHFHASLAIQPRGNERQVIFKGLCQNSLQSLGSNVLKSRREFSSSLPNRHRQRIWAKEVDHKDAIKLIKLEVRLRKQTTKSTLATSPSARNVRRRLTKTRQEPPWGMWQGLICRLSAGRWNC